VIRILASSSIGNISDAGSSRPHQEENYDATGSMLYYQFISWQLCSLESHPDSRTIPQKAVIVPDMRGLGPGDLFSNWEKEQEEKP
jgi:hypothetical protein